jgi:hypothetical protein
VDDGYIGPPLQNSQTWYPFSMPSDQFLSPALYSNQNIIYSAAVFQPVGASGNMFLVF